MRIVFLGNSKPSGKAHPVSQVKYIVEYLIFSIESLPRAEEKKNTNSCNKKSPWYGSTSHSGAFSTNTTWAHATYRPIHFFLMFLMLLQR